MKHIKMLIPVFMFLVIASYVDAGCCKNPNADPPRICSVEESVSVEECCPDPIEYDHYYGGDGPIDQIHCETTEFFCIVACDSGDHCVDICRTQGCCCVEEETPRVRSELTCDALGGDFHGGVADCDSVCGVFSNCNDNIDNDLDGCTDLDDIECAGPTTGVESVMDETCKGSGTDCDNPKIITFTAKPVKGEKYIELEWTTNCDSKVQIYELYRCEGDRETCSDNKRTLLPIRNKFIDGSDVLEFGKTYTYKIKIDFGGSQTDEAIATASPGDLECWHRYDTNVFCIPEENKAYYCNNRNELIAEGTECSSPKICVAAGKEAYCLDETGMCIYDEAKPFGLYYEETCDDVAYCFYDNSYTTVDSCFGCGFGMACYDYKSKQACVDNKCGVGDCEWRSLESIGFGMGVCVDKNKDNCHFCNMRGTPGLGNIQAHDAIYEQCTEEKANLLSVLPEYKCYYSEGEIKSCFGFKCTDYKTEGECTDDECELGICEWSADEGCRNPNSGNEECQEDKWEPTTTISVKGEVYKSLIIEILDRTKAEETPLSRTSHDYTTFLCKDICTKSDFSDSIFTNNYELPISGLTLWDKDGAKELLYLDEGPNTISYYSVDPCGNEGGIDTVKDVTAYENLKYPKVSSLELIPGIEIDDIHYTQSTQPQIRVNFIEEAKIISASFDEEDLTPNPEFKKTFVFDLQNEYDEGTYTFELDAENEQEISLSDVLGERYKATIVIDTGLETPSITYIIEESQVTITIVFNEEVILKTVTIDGEEIKDKFTTNDDIIFTATVTLEDGNKEIIVIAEDFAGHTITTTSSFTVNAEELEITLVEPSYNVSPTYTFNILVKTDNNAECKYSLYPDSEWDVMTPFISEGTNHRIENFNEIPDGSIKIHDFYVECNDPEKVPKKEEFELRVDPYDPEIEQAYAYPNPIAELPRTTEFTVRTDKDVVCKYDAASQNFNAMTGKFPGFDDNKNHNFSNINKVKVTVDEDKEYRYFVACMSKAERVSYTAEITFNVDVSLPLEITDHTEPYSSTRKITLSVETNKEAQCYYAHNDPDVSPENARSFGGLGHIHKKVLQLDLGTYYYYVRCKDTTLGELSDAIQIEFTIDTSPPVMKYVNDSSKSRENPEYTSRNDSLRVKWLAKDEETNIIYYNYSLFESGNSDPIINWTTSFEEDEWVKVYTDDPELTEGETYFFKVKAKNAAGLVSDEEESDGITVDTSLKPDTCSNNRIDLGESDVDCGGLCDPCEEGKICGDASDCISGFCNMSFKCASPGCNDDERNGDETDTDCGGSCDECANGKTCERNSDCLSGLCSNNICKETDTCNDGILSNTETDLDCGGICPGCSEGEMCDSDDDCQYYLECISDVCEEREEVVVITEEDSDNDGLPDDWESRYGLDPNDPSDAEEDFDGDGLTNLQEYDYGTDPFNKDTDGDGADDKKEIDKGTDPLDPEDKPGGFLGKLFLIILIVAVLGVGGYVGYSYYFSKSKPKEPIKPSLMPAYTHTPHRPVPRKPLEKERVREIVERRRKNKEKRRKKLLENFGGKGKGVKEKPLVSLAKGKTPPKTAKKEEALHKSKLISKKE